MTWNFDIGMAPKDGRKVLLATKCGKVLPSNYLAHKSRWLMLADGEQPVAWMPWPEHPTPAPAEENVQYDFLD